MRVVLDTNILVSSLLRKGGNPAKLRDAWQSGNFSVITSRDQIESLTAVLTRPKFSGKLRQEDVGKLLDDLKNSAIQVEPKRDVQASRDPEDNLILGTAVAGKAQYLVTGDKRDLQHLKEYQGIKIINAAQASAILRNDRVKEENVPDQPERGTKRDEGQSR